VVHASSGSNRARSLSAPDDHSGAKSIEWRLN
jgi:hypothetical protein